MELIENFIDFNGLFILNQPNDPYTFSSLNGDDNIDLTITSGSLFNKITSWSV